MAQLVQGGQSKEAKTMAGKLSGDERNSRMASLRSERKQLRSGSGQLLKMHRAEHVRILQQGQGSKHELKHLPSCLFRGWNLPHNTWRGAGSDGSGFL